MDEMEGNQKQRDERSLCSVKKINLTVTVLNMIACIFFLCRGYCICCIDWAMAGQC